MRLWSYQILDVLPQEQLISQWRECVAIKRQWEKGTLKHRLVSYVMKWQPSAFYYYTEKVINEMNKRNIKYQQKFLDEIYNFCMVKGNAKFNYPEHNDRYLRQCLYNLEEKATRGIINKEEWQKIYNKYKDRFDLWNGE